ncbi:MAG: hypothetical protein WC438_01020 [Candidatus Pacearchaeota archaeon]
MTDAFSDISRDEERDELWGVCLRDIAIYLQKPTKKNKKLVMETAKAIDSVKGSYREVPKTNLTASLESNLEPLKNQDKTVWARLLFSLEKDSEIYQQLKSLSPFKDLALIYNGKGCFLEQLYNLVQQQLKQKGFDRKGNYVLNPNLSQQDLESLISKADIIPLNQEEKK